MKKRTITVNVVILAGGKFGKNVGDTTPISFIKAYGFYFRVDGNFREEDKSVKNVKITPTRKFPRLQYIINIPF